MQQVPPTDDPLTYEQFRASFDAEEGRRTLRVANIPSNTQPSGIREALKTTWETLEYVHYDAMSVPMDWKHPKHDFQGNEAKPTNFGHFFIRFRSTDLAIEFWYKVIQKVQAKGCAKLNPKNAKSEKSMVVEWARDQGPMWYDDKLPDPEATNPKFPVEWLTWCANGAPNCGRSNKLDDPRTIANNRKWENARKAAPEQAVFVPRNNLSYHQEAQQRQVKKQK
jgi:hypothetical protein